MYNSTLDSQKEYHCTNNNASSLHNTDVCVHVEVVVF